MKVVVVIISLFTFIPTFAGNIDKAFTALQNFNYFEAKKLFEKSIKKEYVAANFGLASIYIKNDNPFFNVDSAYSTILRAEKNYGALKDKKKEVLKKYGLDYAAITSIRQNVSSNLYSKATQLNSELAYHDFILKNSWAKELPKAVHLRDSIAFSSAMKLHTSAAFHTFLEKYPQSSLKDDAKINLTNCSIKKIQKLVP